MSDWLKRHPTVVANTLKGSSNTDSKAGFMFEILFVFIHARYDTLKNNPSNNNSTRLPTVHKKLSCKGTFEVHVIPSFGYLIHY